MTATGRPRRFCGRFRPLILRGVESDGALPRLRWRHRIPQRIKHLPDLSAGVATESILLERECLGLVCQVVETLCQLAMAARQFPQLHEGPPEAAVDPPPSLSPFHARFEFQKPKLRPRTPQRNSGSATTYPPPPGAGSTPDSRYPPFSASFAVAGVNQWL